MGRAARRAKRLAAQQAELQAATPEQQIRTVEASGTNVNMAAVARFAAASSLDKVLQVQEVLRARMEQLGIKDDPSLAAPLPEAAGEVNINVRSLLNLQDPKAMQAVMATISQRTGSVAANVRAHPNSHAPKPKK